MSTLAVGVVVVVVVVGLEEGDENKMPKWEWELSFLTAKYGLPVPVGEEDNWCETAKAPQWLLIDKVADLTVEQ